MCTFAAARSDSPQRLQNRRLGGLPSPHCPQTRSPSCSCRVGTALATGRRAALISWGVTACGWPPEPAGAPETLASSADPSGRCAGGPLHEPAPGAPETGAPETGPAALGGWLP